MANRAGVALLVAVLLAGTESATRGGPFGKAVGGEGLAGRAGGSPCGGVESTAPTSRRTRPG